MKKVLFVNHWYNSIIRVIFGYNNLNNIKKERRLLMTNKKLTPEEISKIEKSKLEKAKKDANFVPAPSDSEFDICGPLNCDKEL